MHEPAPPYNLKNAAWVVVPTRLPPQALLSFCRDVERLFRLNPFLKITAWHQQNKSDYSIEWENHSNVRPIYLSTQLKLEVADNALQLRYSTGIKDKTHFIVEQAERGSRLIIVDDYGDSDQRDVEQVDKSLTAWGRTLASFFAGYRMLKTHALGGPNPGSLVDSTKSDRQKSSLYIAGDHRSGVNRFAAVWSTVLVSVKNEAVVRRLVAQ